MQISAIQAGNYLSKSYSQPLKPQKAQTVVSNSSLPKNTVSFSGIFTRSHEDDDKAAENARIKRYGNTEISRVAPEIITVAISRLEEMGFENIKRSNIHIIHEQAAENDYEHDNYNIISYYDEKKEASVLFTNDADIAYMVKYRYSPAGEIIGHYTYRYYDFNTKKWNDASRNSFLLIP